MIAIMESPLFVYGTLRSDFRNRWARRLWNGAEPIGNARVQGRLYLLGALPGMTPARLPGEWVYGQLVAPRRLLRWLDRYEGPDFQRLFCVSHLERGQVLRAWAYFYVGQNRGTRIWSGRFTTATRFASRKA